MWGMGGWGHRFWPFSYKKTQTHSLSVTDFGDLTDVTLAALGDSTVLVDDLARAMLVSFSKGWSLVEILNLNLRQKFGRDLVAEFWSRYWCWGLGNILKHKFGEAYEAEVKELDAEVWSQDWSWFWINIGVRTYVWFELKAVIWGYLSESTKPWVRCAFAMFTLYQLFGKGYITKQKGNARG